MFRVMKKRGEARRQGCAACAREGAGRTRETGLLELELEKAREEAYLRWQLKWGAVVIAVDLLDLDLVNPVVARINTFPVVCNHAEGHGGLRACAAASNGDSGAMHGPDSQGSSAPIHPSYSHTTPPAEWYSALRATSVFSSHGS